MTRTELVYGVAAAGANILGALAVTSGRRWSVEALDRLLAFAAGFLLSVAFVDLVPEALAQGGRRAAIIALGAYLLVHFTQHTLGRHFHFGEETHAVSALVSRTALIGLMLHTFVDGVAVASGVLVSSAVGVMVFVGVLIHKLPEGLAISSLFLAAGASRRAAILAAASLGAVTLLGVVATHAIMPLETYGLAISAGVTIYVGASNLVPEIQARHGAGTPLSFLGGCLVYFAGRFALHS